MIKIAQHVAVKCTYNNGDEGVYVGFNGICSENIIKFNIKSGRVWCSQSECKCKQYYNSEFNDRKKPDEPCYESILFRDWGYGAGSYHTGKRSGTPIHLSRVDIGKIAILTTRFPNDKEIDRRIIGFFKIARVTNNPNEDTRMYAYEKFRLRLLMEEAKELYFWDYYSTKGRVFWGSGLIRYLNDDKVARLLIDLRQTLRDEKAKAMVDILLTKDFPKVTPLPASGPRIKKSGNIIKRVSVTRKYGSGGEGNEHRKLKEWIAQNPKEIGLTNVKKAETEYVFASGDAADIMFELEGDTYVVVEIETLDPYPGCHQALKYRVLKCAELGLDIKSPKVKAILIAWSIPEEIKSFCKKYGIRFEEKKI